MKRIVPCSIWMPPAASGPVFTVSRPILTGLPCAKAGSGSVVAAVTAAVPTRKDRRSIRVTMDSLLGSASSLVAARQLQRRALLRHPAADRHVAELVPDTIDLGHDGGVGLLDVDRVRGGHPARPAGDPEDLRSIAFGIEEVAADGAGVVDDPLDAIALGHQATAEGAQVVEAVHAHGDLLDEPRAVGRLPAAHERDLVIDRAGVGAEEDHAGSPVLLGDLHAQQIAVEGNHPLEVVHVDPDVTESRYPWHGVPPCLRTDGAPRIPDQRLVAGRLSFSSLAAFSPLIFARSAALRNV